MEGSNVIKDRQLTSIDKANDNRVRIVGKVTHFDVKTGIFELSDNSGMHITCLPSPTQENKLKEGTFVVVAGRVASAGENEIELRTEYVSLISEKEYLNYYDYLNLREELMKKWK